MKILFVVNTLSNGGAEKVVATLSNKMAENGHEVHVIQVYNSIKYEIDNQVKIHYLLDKQDRISFLKKGISTIKLSKLLKTKVNEIEKNGKFDLITSHLILADVISFLAKIDTYSCIHNNYSEHPFFRKKFNQLFLKLIYKNKKVLGISHGVLKDWKESIGIKTKDSIVVYNPIDVNKVRKLSNDKSVNIINENYIVHVGRFSKQKRHDILIRAFSKIEGNYKLVLIGEGETQQDIQKLVNELNLNEKVIFKGWCKNPYPWIKNAKLLVLTSDTEGLPIVALESISLGTPIVCTRFCGVDEIMQYSLSKYVCEPRNVDDIAAKITQCLRNGKFDMTDNLIDDILDNFKIENVVNNYLSLIK